MHVVYLYCYNICYYCYNVIIDAIFYNVIVCAIIVVMHEQCLICYSF